MAKSAKSPNSLARQQKNPPDGLLRNHIKLCRNAVVLGDLLNFHELFQALFKQFLEWLSSPAPTVGEDFLVVVLQCFRNQLDGYGEEKRHHEEKFQPWKATNPILIFGHRATVAIDHKVTGPT